MNRSFAFISIAALTLCVSQVGQAAEKKNPEANKLAREGVEAAKSQDFDKAVDLLKKANAMDKKYGDELSAVYQQRAYAAATDQRYGDAINDTLVVDPGRRVVGGLVTMDRVLIDGTVEGGSAAVGGFSGVFRRVQNGFVRSYALSVLLGAVLVVVALLAVNLA